MRNHTATHLLHSALHEVLGLHARQAGSLVAPKYLRFDFTHPEALTKGEIEDVEDFVNHKILSNHLLQISEKTLDEALAGGANALFGEKYDEIVRNITIGEGHPFSNELCGGTHVHNTAEVGTFIIISEGSAAAGIRRIEAVTGSESYNRIKQQTRTIDQLAKTFDTPPDQLPEVVDSMITESKQLRKQVAKLRESIAAQDFVQVLDQTPSTHGINYLTAIIPDVGADTLRQLADRFRQRYPERGVAVLASVVNQRPIIIAAVTQDLVPHGIKAGDLAGFVAKQLGGGGGGKPTLAQAGGKNPEKIDAALASVKGWLEDAFKD
jgi:alanyl-tRNA synthetase